MLPGGGSAVPNDSPLRCADIVAGLLHGCRSDDAFNRLRHQEEPASLIGREAALCVPCDFVVPPLGDRFPATDFRLNHDRLPMGSVSTLFMKSRFRTRS
jgi:hypothetical protein